MSVARRTIVAVALVAGTGLPAAASGEAGGSLGELLITPKFGTIIWTLVTFLTMAFILGKYAWRPLIGALEDREKSIRDSIEQAKADREQAGTMLEEQRGLVAQARRERAEALAQGRQDAERVKSELLEEAGQQRDQMLKQTQAQVATAMRQARDELRGEAAELAIRAAERLMSRNLDDSAHRRLVEEYLDDLERGGGSAPLPS